MSDRVVAFDLMDTLLRDPYRDAIVAGFGRPLAELATLDLPSVWPAFEAGHMTEAAYWQAYRDAGHAIDPEAFHAARRDGYAWLDGMPSLLDDLAGVPLALATNYPHWVDEVVDGWLGDRFDVVVSSHGVGARKPEPAFYEAVLEAVARPPGDVVFVDDREHNVDAALALGIDAIRFTGAPALRAELAERSVL